MTRFVDRAVLDGTLTKTDDGWAVMAKVARGGNVQAYLGSEMGVTDKAIVRVYRPEAEVFDRKAFATYARKPITMGHPAGGVSPDTWKDLAVGEIDRDVVRDGEFVTVPLLFRDATAFATIMADGGPRELSMGYDAKVTMGDGVTPSGEAYDAIMSDFRMNHAAVVASARGGSELRIGDGANTWGASPVHDAAKKEGVMPELRKIVVDGLSVETTDAGAQAIEKLTGVIAAKDKALTDATTAHDKAIAAKDADLAAKDAEIVALKAKVMDAAALDALVQDRAALVAKVKAIAPDLKTDGLDAPALRKSAVIAKLGGAAIAGKSEAYIDARFDILCDAVPDLVADALKNTMTTDATKPDPVKARAQMIADMTGATAKKEA